MKHTLIFCILILSELFVNAQIIDTTIVSKDNYLAQANFYKNAHLYELSDSSQFEIYYWANQVWDHDIRDWTNKDVKPTIGSITLEKGDMVTIKGVFNNWEVWDFKKIGPCGIAKTSKFQQFQHPVVWPNNLLGIAIVSVGFWSKNPEIDLGDMEVTFNELSFEAVIIDLQKTRRFIFLGIVAR